MTSHTSCAPASVIDQSLTFTTEDRLYYIIIYLVVDCEDPRWRDGHFLVGRDILNEHIRSAQSFMSNETVTVYGQRQ